PLPPRPPLFPYTSTNEPLQSERRRALRDDAAPRPASSARARRVPCLYEPPLTCSRLSTEATLRTWLAVSTISRASSALSTSPRRVSRPPTTSASTLDLGKSGIA